MAKEGAKYYQGKPVQVIGDEVYPLPAPLPITAKDVQDSAEDYDAGAEAEAAGKPAAKSDDDAA